MATILKFGPQIFETYFRPDRMGKYDSYIVQKIQFLKLHYYLLLWSIHRNYYTALKMFKIFDSMSVDSKDDEDEMDYLSPTALVVKLIGSSLVKQ